jgi:hypothetical protein
MTPRDRTRPPEAIRTRRPASARTVGIRGYPTGSQPLGWTSVRRQTNGTGGPILGVRPLRGLCIRRCRLQSRWPTLRSLDDAREGKGRHGHGVGNRPHPRPGTSRRLPGKCIRLGRARERVGARFRREERAPPRRLKFLIAPPFRDFREARGEGPHSKPQDRTAHRVEGGLSSSPAILD